MRDAAPVPNRCPTRASLRLTLGSAVEPGRRGTSLTGANATPSDSASDRVGNTRAGCDGQNDSGDYEWQKRHDVRSSIVRLAPRLLPRLIFRRTQAVASYVTLMDTHDFRFGHFDKSRLVFLRNMLNRLLPKELARKGPGHSRKAGRPLAQATGPPPEDFDLELGRVHR